MTEPDERATPPRTKPEFDRRHAGWLAGVAEGPLYRLAGALVESLALPGSRRPPLDEAAAAAERDLAALCGRLHAAGFDGGRAIDYPFLAPPPPYPEQGDSPEMGWPAGSWIKLRRAGAMVEQVRLRLKGYAGWLLTEPTYLAEVGGLEARWRDLPAGSRPSLPLKRATAAAAPGPAVVRYEDPCAFFEDLRAHGNLGDATAFRRVLPPPAAADAFYGGADDLGAFARARPAPPVVDAFAADLTAFLDRWGLDGLATWGLPEPQGPLLPSLLPAGSPALPAHGLHLVVPLHYPIAGDDELLAQIHAQQVGLAADLGLPAGLAGLPHHKAYGQVLEVAHLEATAVARYGRPPGFVGRLEAGLAAALGVSDDQVQRLRKAISACRAGRRAEVRWLAPRTR